MGREMCRNVSWEHGQRSGNEAMAARTLNRLSANLVKALAERGYHADGGGLYFRVSEFGTRLWAFRYTHAGRAREMGLGPYPEVTLKDTPESLRWRPARCFGRTRTPSRSARPAEARCPSGKFA